MQNNGKGELELEGGMTVWGVKKGRDGGRSRQIRKRAKEKKGTPIKKKIMERRTVEVEEDDVEGWKGGRE